MAGIIDSHLVNLFSTIRKGISGLCSLRPPPSRWWCDVRHNETVTLMFNERKLVVMWWILRWEAPSNYLDPGRCTRNVGSTLAETTISNVTTALHAIVTVECLDHTDFAPRCLGMRDPCTTMSTTTLTEMSWRNGIRNGWNHVLNQSFEWIAYSSKNVETTVRGHLNFTRNYDCAQEGRHSPKPVISFPIDCSGANEVNICLSGFLVLQYTPSWYVFKE